MTFRSRSLGDSLRPYLCMMALGLAAAQPLSGQTERKVTKLADGVYEIQHKDEQLGVGSSNTTVIIGDRQVFVVDAGFMPSDAREDIAQIRQWTDKPVSFPATASSPASTRSREAWISRRSGNDLPEMTRISRNNLTMRQRRLLSSSIRR